MTAAQRFGLGMAVAAMALGSAGWAAEVATNEAEGLELSADLGVYSAYVWRGQVINDEPVAQPQLNLEWNGFSAHAWGNYDFTDTTSEEAPTFTEVDLTGAYTFTLGPAELTAAYVHYFFPHQKLVTETETVTRTEDAPSTGEVSLEARCPEWIVSPVLTVARDVKEANATSGSVGAESSMELVAKRLSLEVSATVGTADAEYNAYYFGVDEPAVNYVAAGVALPWTLTESLSLTPGLQYSSLIDHKLRTATADAGDDCDFLVVSLTASYAF